PKEQLLQLSGFDRGRSREILQRLKAAPLPLAVKHLQTRLERVKAVADDLGHRRTSDQRKAWSLTTESGREGRRRRPCRGSAGPSGTIRPHVPRKVGENA